VLSILAPASDAQASPVFCASLARPGSSPFTFAEALDISAESLLAMLLDSRDINKETYLQIAFRPPLDSHLQCRGSSLYRLQQ
jgi:hypothetical protein